MTSARGTSEVVREMAWQEVCSFRYNELDCANKNVCASLVARYLEEDGRRAKLRSGRQPPASLVFYSYCITHQDCKYAEKHEFVTSEGGLQHRIYFKGQHGDVVRAVRESHRHSERRILSDLTRQ